MLTNRSKADARSTYRKSEINGRAIILAICLVTFGFSVGCRYDMQDQPRMKPYKESGFFRDGKAMRDPVKGSVARGQLNEDKAFHTGKKQNIDTNAQVETVTDASGNTIVSSFPNDIEQLPVPLNKALLDRGEDRYKIFCMACHGPVGKGDGMVVRRGYPQPPTYHDDRLRNAPVGHFFDVITNGWGKMNSYSAQIPVADRWAIVSYIRVLQASQNLDAKASTSERPADAPAATSQETTKTDGTQDSNEPPAVDNGGESK